LRVFVVIVLLVGLVGCDWRGSSQGTLVANVGMPLSDVRKRSSLKLARTLGHMTAGATVFDFELAGTGVHATRCGSYWITTTKDAMVDSITIYVSAHKLSRADIEREDRDIRQNLIADGWALGHLTGEEVQPLGDRSRSFWRRNGLLLLLDTRRTDDPQPGENPATAGRWLQDITISNYASDPIYRSHVVFPE